MAQRLRIELTVLITLAIAVTALVLALSGGSGSATDSPVAGKGPSAEVEGTLGQPDATDEITIVDFAFDPVPIRVRAGATIAWTNLDRTSHDATAEDGSWGTATLAPGDTALITFDKPGVYAYICSLHPPRRVAGLGAPSGTELVGGGGKAMRGTIIVD